MPCDPELEAKACPAGPSPESCIPNDMTLTQQTFRVPTFRDAPERPGERDVSLLTGRLTIEDASHYVNPRSSKEARALRRAGVRYTTAGELREQGFAVLHTPGRVTGGPPKTVREAPACREPKTHVSVVWPNAAPLQRQDIPWTDDVVQRFVGCFHGYTKMEDGR
jgi:hypothetical protein